VTDRDPHPADHPELDDDELASQRGDEPAETSSRERRRPAQPNPAPEADPNWRPSRRDRDRWTRWTEFYDGLPGDRRPRREAVLPYLLIRAMTPGDRGQRPLWPPTPCWESPDILLIDATYAGPFDPVRVVASPIYGHSYRVFVHVWNLGLFEAAGVHVRVWFVLPGFFSGETAPQYQPQLIGGAFKNLAARTRPGWHAVVELDAQWQISNQLVGHGCLISAASCPADEWDGGWDANTHRHVGQRNLDVLTGGQDAAPLLAQLGEMLPYDATLEITHGGPAVLPLLHAIAGGRLHPPNDDTLDIRIAAPTVDTLRHGIVSGDEQHLLTLVRDGRTTRVVRSDALAEVLGEQGRGPMARGRVVGAPPGGEVGGPGRRLAAHGEVARAVRELNAEQVEQVGVRTDLSPERALPHSVGALLEVGDLRAESLSNALGGRRGEEHLLRFTATDAQGNLLGGYSLIVGSQPRAEDRRGPARAG
jgi:hypothetical protein